MFILETFVFMMTEEMSQFEASLLLFFFLVLWSLGGSGAVVSSSPYMSLQKGPTCKTLGRQVDVRKGEL